MTDQMEIKEAREFGKKHKLRGVVIIYYDDEHFGTTSWGIDRQECGWARRFAGRAFLEFERMWRQDR